MDQISDVISRAEIGRVALFSGRSLYWSLAVARSSAAGVGGLLEWCCNHPNAWLGIDARSAARLLDSPEDEHWLGGRVADEMYGGRLRACLEGAPATGSHVWLPARDAAWWVEGTKAYLARYAGFQEAGQDGSDLLTLIGRHRCVFFAPIDLAHLGATLFGPAGDQLAQQLAEHWDFARHPLYWSWRLTDFAATSGSLIHTAMLALWSDWPHGRHWGPERPAGFAETGGRSCAQACELLENVMWQKLATIFVHLHEHFDLGIAYHKFDQAQSRDPVFYFAEPGDIPADPLDYRNGDYYPVLHRLTKVCLGSDDPLSEEVSWGILEGDFVTLRREKLRNDLLLPCYLIMPFRRKEISEDEIERDLHFTVSEMTFLDFTIAREARDVFRDYDRITSRHSVLEGTADDLNDLMSDLLPTMVNLPARLLRVVTKELGSIRMAVNQLQTIVQKTVIETGRVQRTARRYISSTETMMRTRLTNRSLPEVGGISLKDAVLDSYPYHLVQDRLTDFRDRNADLVAILDRTSALIEAALREGDEIMRQNLEKWLRRLSVLAALFAPAFALTQFVPGSALRPEVYPAWLEPYLPLSTLEFSVTSLGGIALIVLLGASLYVIGAWVVGAFGVRLADPVARNIQAFWDLAGQAWAAAQLPAAARGAVIEQLDERASGILVELWSAVAPGAAEGPSRWLPLRRWFSARPHPDREQVDRWLRRSRRLRQLISLVDLMPDHIVMPRSLCLLRFKSTDFMGGSPISSSYFENSLVLSGFSIDERTALETWLEAVPNRRQIEDADAATFCRLLRDRGVSADPERRQRDGWRGRLAEDDAAR